MTSFTHDLLARHSRCLDDRTQFEEVPIGWQPLVSDLVDRLAAILSTMPDQRMAVLQIKEKFGRLGFYYRLEPMLENNEPTSLALARLVEDAQHRAGTVCTVCGQPGLLRQRPPRTVQLRCSAHADPLTSPV